MVIRQQWELVRLPYLVGPGDQSQIIRLGSKCLHPPSHLAIPLPSVSYDIADENSHHNSSSSALLEKKKDTIFLRRISSSSSSSGSRLNHCSSVPSDCGCLEYRVNLELVLCPCLKKDCLDLEEWRVLESTKEQSRCDTQTDCQRLIQATFHSSSSSLQALANLKKKLTGHTEGKKRFPPESGLGALQCWRPIPFDDP